jgi:hypothetical protein
LVHAAVGRAVLERRVRRKAQTLDTLCNHRFDVALAVVPVLGKMAQEGRIWPTGLKQFARHAIHLGEALVADDYIEVVVGVDERARHVLERHMHLRLLRGQIALRLFLFRHIGHHGDDAAARDRPPADSIHAAVRRFVLECFAGRVAEAFHTLRH